MEVGGEECVYGVSGLNPTITSLVDQLVSAVHQDALHESRPEMRRVLDAEQASSANTGQGAPYAASVHPADNGTVLLIPC